MYSLLLFCGSITLDTTGRGLIVDGWLRLRGWARIGVFVSRLRMMLDDILAARFDSPDSGAGSESGTGSASDANTKENRVIALVKRLVEFNGLDQ